MIKSIHFGIRQTWVPAPWFIRLLSPHFASSLAVRWESHRRPKNAMRWDSLKSWVGRRDFKRHMGPRKEASKSLEKGEKDSVSKETPEGLLALYWGQQGISWALGVTGVDWVAADAGPTCHRSQHKVPELWLAVPVTSRSPEMSFFLHPESRAYSVQGQERQMHE